jgi:mRNA interferase RelE/StbE
VKRYTVYVIPSAWKEIKDLPGHMRQRVRRAVDALAENPHPARSKQLDVPDLEPELRRLRVDVLAVRKRPPYDYDDLEDLIAEVL